MTGTGNKAALNNKWLIAIPAANFFVAYNGFQIILKNYLQEERLSVTYFFVIGLVSALIAFVLTFVTKGKGVKVRVFVTILLLAVIVFLNIFIR